MTDHEAAVAAFLAQAERDDPERYRAVCARYPVNESPREFASDQLDILAVRFPDPVNEGRHRLTGSMQEGASDAMPPPAVTAMNQRRPRRRASSRPRGRPRRAVPFLPLAMPIVLGR